MSWLAVGCGAAIGAWLRWLLGIALNSAHAVLPYGTLAANLAGGFMIGVAVGFFERYPGLPVEWRLFAVTGFLGGLTTFSTFSAESMMLLQRGQYGWALAHIGLHLMGSIACCIAGFAAYRAVVG
ncbi:MAG: crcB [Burkholderia sp.]|nr:crcB [Burkholderia sp.]